MNKMQKLTCAKVLKVIFYLLGFPLLMLFVAKDSMIFFNEGAFSETAKKEVEALLKTSFRPEFLNRLDEIVIFKPLQKGEIEKIVKLFVSSLRERLAEKRLTLEITDKACAYLAENGYDPVLGARPLKRYVQQAVETPLAKELLAGRFLPGDTVKIDASDSGVIITNPKK